jgi:hypothetical protein
MEVEVMTQLFQVFNALSLAEQFQAGALLIICLVVILLAAVVWWPELRASGRALRRWAADLFHDDWDLEDDEQRLVEAAQRRRNADRLMAQYYPSVAKRVETLPPQADASDRRAILEAIAHMSHPTNRIH